MADLCGGRSGSADIFNGEETSEKIQQEGHEEEPVVSSMIFLRVPRALRGSISFFAKSNPPVR
jgi:hypothetical protein